MDISTSVMLIAGLLLLITIFLLVLLVKAFKAFSEAQKLFELARLQLTPISHDITRITTEVKGILHSVQKDVDKVGDSLEHIRKFIFDGLNNYDQSDLESMGMADFFHPEVKWYGPGGIGACLSFSEFETLHQQPWLTAFPDRAVQNLDALFAEGNYSGAPGWSGVKATHTGDYLNHPPTGNKLEFNGLDWWKRNGEVYIENWVFVDMIHLFRQFGVDLFDRMKQLHGE